MSFWEVVLAVVVGQVLLVTSGVLVALVLARVLERQWRRTRSFSWTIGREGSVSNRDVERAWELLAQKWDDSGEAT